MKIIRPEQPITQKKEENLSLIIDGHEVTPFTKDDLQLVSDTTKPLDYVMNEVLENAKDVTFEITLTKKQKELWDKKGGIKWLKKALVGQKLNSPKK